MVDVTDIDTMVHACRAMSVHLEVHTVFVRVAYGRLHDVTNHHQPIQKRIGSPPSSFR